MTLKDSAGTTRTAPSNITVNLREPGTGAFYSDAGCVTPATTVTITSGGSTATFYYQAPTAQTIGAVTTATNLDRGYIVHSAL